MDTAAPPPPRKVLIAGGSLAAVEALLALRALLGQRVSLTLISSDERLALGVAATYEVFDSKLGLPISCSLREIAADAQARFYHDRLEAVAPAVHSVQLASGTRLGYDYLILALGARAQVAIPGALTFRDRRDVSRMRALLQEIERGVAYRVLFAIPSGCAWPLPLYELAMFTAAHADQVGVEVQISLVSPEGAPLEIAGAKACTLMRALLMERGVRFRGGLVPAGVRHDGALQLHFDGTIPADRVVAAPQLRGSRIVGVPSRWWGFVAVDAEGRVEGLNDAYAAGDMTSCPIRQGVVAAQHADLIARLIATQDGIDVAVPPTGDHGRMIEAQLLAGARTFAMRARLDTGGAHHPSSGVASVIPLRKPASMQGSVGGRYLRSYLASRGVDASATRNAEQQSP